MKKELILLSKAVVVCSGGLDSTVAAYLAEYTFGDVALISFDYGQRHKKELEYAKRIATHLGASHEVVDLAAISRLIDNSALTNKDIAVPHGHYEDSNMKTTVVPNRNMIMISIAAAYAVNIGAEHVVVGVHGGDHFIYPDCRPEFIKSVNETVYLANKGYSQFALDGNRTVFAPFINMSKAGIVEVGARHNVPFQDTWSCYEGGEHHCGRCATCIERKEAFEVAGVKDPTIYADSRSWKVIVDEVLP